MDALLEKFNLKYEDLNSIERDTLNTMMESLRKNELTVAKIRDYISMMREAVEQDLTKVGFEYKQDIYLKARLRNYMLLEAFLTSPDKAQKAIETALAGIPKQKK